MEEDGAALADSLSGIRWQTLGVVGILSLLMVAELFRTVKQGSRTIAQQRRDLAERVVSLSKLLEQNTELQARLQDVNRRSTDTNDRALRRIGAELHDGPVQLIALALLRLETLHQPASGGRTAAELEEFDAVEAALRDALKEIRGLSAGLALPDLQGVPVAKAIEFAVMNHERRSRTRVKLDLSANLPVAADLPILACAYRLTQESLNNAVRHAGGKEQMVKGTFENGVLTIEVSDKGPGLKPQRGHESEQGLGLIGLRDRLHSLGGTLDIKSTPGCGTRIIAAIDLGAYGRRDVAALSA
jgi:signal transduction histidine kinase